MSTITLAGFSSETKIDTAVDIAAPISIGKPDPWPGDTERFFLARPWVLAKCVRSASHPGWDYVGEVASTLTHEACVAANMLLTGQAEMGLAKPWRGARTFLTYDPEGNLTDPPPTEDEDDDDDDEDTDA